VGTACLGVDWYCYGASTITLPPFNFIRVNIVHKYAALYGVQPMHWNFSQVCRGHPAL
jgi:hypothetical protein